MILNKLEFWMMNNPIRAWIQENYELPVLLEMLDKREFGSVLEIGCGNGNGTRLINDYFQAGEITAVDLDDKMIVRARARQLPDSVNFLKMDASRLDFPDQSFDAAFDFGIIHHIPNWRECLSELHRVLKPGGSLVVEDLSAETFKGPVGGIWTALSKHPYHKMYTEQSFLAELNSLGFELQGFRRRNPLGLILHFALVARKKTGL